jgi:predicted metal-dependent phosphoesterase TrpH
MSVMPRTYDLHCHSTASDGTLAPGELLARAHRNGVNVLALTDHDTTAGLAEAGRAARRLGVELVSGVEISVTWRACTIHMVGLQFDPDAQALQQGLAQLREFRHWRAAEIARRLEKAGIPGAAEGARALARGELVSRTHFAQFLVARGHAARPRDVFKRYLVQGKPGYVPGNWAELEQAVGWIRDAGGVAVIAHPARYRLTATKLRELLGEFVECGGNGLEVVTGSHTPDQCRTMAGVARRHGLSASAGSDYHGPEDPWLELGALPPFPADCLPIWESEAWQECAAEAAAG